MTAPADHIGADATLHFGDVQERWKSLQVDAPIIVTDPPYLITSGGASSGGGRMKGGWIGDYGNTGKPVICEISWPEIMAIIAAAAAANSDIYVFCEARNLRPALNAAEVAGLKFHNVLTWDKVTATANRWYMKNNEFVLYLYKGRARAINDCGSKAGTRFPHRDVTKHPTEKPVGLLRHYIENSSAPGDLVADPFAGTASTGVAAIEAGRRFIGCEIDPKWHQVGAERLASARVKSGMFAVTEPKLKQTSFFDVEGAR
jgi:site-specific DNA-methyltransferase (adenine-specific)